jgi:hypothetical protein
MSEMMEIRTKKEEVQHEWNLETPFFIIFVKEESIDISSLQMAQKNKVLHEVTI